MCALHSSLPRELKFECPHCLRGKPGEPAAPAPMQEEPTTQASASCEDVQGGEFDFGEAQEQLAGDDVAASEVSAQVSALFFSLVCL